MRTGYILGRVVLVRVVLNGLGWGRSVLMLGHTLSRVVLGYRVRVILNGLGWGGPALMLGMGVCVCLYGLGGGCSWDGEGSLGSVFKLFL